jgi:hypothetical protein
VGRARALTSAAARSLFAEVVDYAGLFPPAQLPLDAAVGEYARWRGTSERWLLGRFVVPATRLPELTRSAAAALPDAASGDPWPIAALLGTDARADAPLVSSFNARHVGRARVDTVELRAGAAGRVEPALEALPDGCVAYVELPLSADPSAALTLLRSRDARAKGRTGGVVADAIPSPAELARFIVACAGARVPFKVTSGLHRALRGERALTYAADSPVARMHGFLNVFAAAALAWKGAGPAEVEAVLAEEDPSSFHLDDEGLRWRGLGATSDELGLLRSSFACSFGSCSFAEPVADLRSLGMIG